MVHLHPTRLEPTLLADGVRRALWIALLTGASIAFSLIFACATPFAALTTLAARNMKRLDAFLLTIAVWLANQAVGYGILNYPRSFDSFAWGGAIGIAALMATTAALAVTDRPSRIGPFFATLTAFGAAFVVYEAALFATTFVLPSGDEAFSPHIVLYILQVNAMALVGLYVVARLAPMVGLPRSLWRGTPSASIDGRRA